MKSVVFFIPQIFFPQISQIFAENRSILRFICGFLRILREIFYCNHRFAVTSYYINVIPIFFIVSMMYTQDDTNALLKGIVTK